MPEMISIGWPRASRARSRKVCLRCALAQSIGAHDAHAFRVHVAQALPETLQALECALGDGLVEPALIVQSGGEAHHFAQAIEDGELAVRIARHDHVEAVRSEIDSRDDVRNFALRFAQGSDGKRRTAAAGRRGVRIADHELRALEVFAVVDLRAHQVLEAHRIDDQLHALVLDTGVAFLDVFVKGETVLKSRAASALHEDAQLQVGIRFPTDQLADLGGSGIGESQILDLSFGVLSYGVIHQLVVLNVSYMKSSHPAPTGSKSLQVPPTGAGSGPTSATAPGSWINLPLIEAPIVISITP